MRAGCRSAGLPPVSRPPHQHRTLSGRHLPGAHRVASSPPGRRPTPRPACSLWATSGPAQETARTLRACVLSRHSGSLCGSCAVPSRLPPSPLLRQLLTDHAEGCCHHQAPGRAGSLGGKAGQGARPSLCPSLSSAVECGHTRGSGIHEGDRQVWEPGLRAGHLGCVPFRHAGDATRATETSLTRPG